MKKVIFVISIFFLNIILLKSLNLEGIDKWIINFPSDKTTFLNYKIKNFIIENTGIMLTLAKEETLIKISIINPITEEELTKRFASIENILLDKKTMLSDKWNLKLSDIEINFEPKGDILITLKFDKFQIKIDNNTTLELKNKLKNDPLFIYRSAENTMLGSIIFNEVNLNSGIREKFTGWNLYINNLIKWFEAGLSSNNQEIMALIVETKIMNIAETEKEKTILLNKSDKSNNWIGLNVDYLFPNIISGEYNGVFINPFTYNIIELMANFSFRNLGYKDWIVKPIQINLFLGGYFELNAGYFSRKDKGEFNNFPNNGSFMVAGGPTVGISISGFIPKIRENRQIGNLFGLGLESITTVNIPYFFPDFYYEYFFNQFINLIIHLIPDYKVKPDIIIGLNIALVNRNFSELDPTVIVSKFGLVLGIRLLIDLYNFNKQ